MRVDFLWMMVLLLVLGDVGWAGVMLHATLAWVLVLLAEEA